MADQFEIKVDASRVLRALERARRREIKAAQRTGITKVTRIARAEVKKQAPRGVPASAIKSRVRTKRDVIGGTVWGAWPYRLLLTGTAERRTRSGAYRGRIQGTDAFAHAASVADPQARGIVEREMKIRLDRTGLSTNSGGFFG